LISEAFVSIQGEGKTQGKPSIFIRFQGCNLRCKWCDTKYSSYPEYFSKKTLNLDQVFNFIKKNKQINNIIFTGGEPLLFQKEILTIMKKFKEKNFEIETNGTIEVKKEILEFKPLFNISPKPIYSQIGEFQKKLGKLDYKLLNQLLNLNYQNFIVKFVISSKRDLDFVEKIKRDFLLNNEKIYLQANCQSKEDCTKRSKEIIKICLKKGYNFSPRLQFLLGFK
jgi:7-carboxy-7-deazaguanine synthase